MIAACIRCRNTGTIFDGHDVRYCDCPAAMVLQARLENDPEYALQRAEVDYLKAKIEESALPRAVETPVETGPDETDNKSRN